MDEYTMKILIEELQKLVVSLRMESNSKQFTIDGQKLEIDGLKSEVERLENLLTPKIENKK